ncbi:MAG: lipopolysaccharide biosynthesis protein [Firmicutes bacterium]|nr:lipopolysaccharide biosynthesis protein [Bacillota bacterium]
MATSSTKSKVLHGIFWKLMERGGTQALQFIIQIILARLLLPADYGVIALIAIFIAIASVFVHSGFNTALIQKKNADKLDFSSVFYLSLFVSILMYGFLYLSAPAIARFYDESQIIPVLRVLSITLFFGAVNSVQYAVVSREMKFKKVFFSSLGGMLFSGILGIGMAFMGFGVWALVAQHLVQQILITFILWFTVKWRPSSEFSLARLRNLFAFGGKLLCSSLLETVYHNIYGLVIGKFYNAEMLGYFTRGDQFPKLLMTNINSSISSVMLPALSAHQEDKNRVKAMVRRSIVTSSFVIFPLMAGLAVCAEPLVNLLLTEKWLPCVPFLQIMCLAYAFWPVHTANLQAINALGRSDIFLKLEIIKKCIGVAALLISVPFGIYVMVAFKPVTSVISTAINSYPNRKLLDYSFKEQWIDIMPSLLLSVVMGAAIYTVNYSGWNELTKLFVQVIAGIVIYTGLAYLLKLECFIYLLDTVKQLLHKNAERKWNCNE